MDLPLLRDALLGAAESLCSSMTDCTSVRETVSDSTLTLGALSLSDNGVPLPLVDIDSGLLPIVTGETRTLGRLARQDIDKLWLDMSRCLSPINATLARSNSGWGRAAKCAVSGWGRDQLPAHSACTRTIRCCGLQLHRTAGDRVRNVEPAQILR